MCYRTRLDLILNSFRIFKKLKKKAAAIAFYNDSVLMFEGHDTKRVTEASKLKKYSFNKAKPDFRVDDDLLNLRLRLKRNDDEAEKGEAAKIALPGNKPFAFTT